MPSVQEIGLDRADEELSATKTTFTHQTKQKINNKIDRTIVSYMRLNTDWLSGLDCATLSENKRRRQTKQSNIREKNLEGQMIVSYMRLNTDWVSRGQLHVAEYRLGERS